MTCQLLALCIDADDPLRLARFWSGVLGWELADDSGDGVSLVPSDDTGLRIRFLPAQETKPGLNPGHLHLTSTSLEDQQQTVARSLGLGARHVDIGQRPEEGHIVISWDSWDGAGMMPKAGKNRLHFDLAPPAHGDQQEEVDRLVSLGATRIDIGQDEVSWVVMADPDGRRFCVLLPR